MSARIEPTITLTSPAQLVRYLGRIAEVTVGPAGVGLYFIADAPPRLDDPTQAFTLIPAAQNSDASAGTLQLTNARVAEGDVTFKPLATPESAEVVLAGDARNPFDRRDEVSALEAAVKSYEREAAGSMVAFQLGLQDDRPELNRAWLACSAALSLDGELARRIVEPLLPEGTDIGGIIYRLKELPGSWKDGLGDGWSIAEDTRPELVAHLHDRLPAEIVDAVRRTIADYRDEEAARIGEGDGTQLTDHRLLLARHEAAFQRTVVASERARGASDWRALWERLDGEPRRSLAEAVFYLAPHLESLIEVIPADVRKVIAGGAPRSEAYRGYRERVDASIRALGLIGYDVNLDEYADVLAASMARKDSPKQAAWNVEKCVRASAA